MGSGGFVLCEWKSVQKEFPDFQKAFSDLESTVIEKANMDWSPKRQGYLTPTGDQWGRTTILPELFNSAFGMSLAHWRLSFFAAGHQTLFVGGNAGNTIPEDFKLGWMGLSFGNEQMNVTEIRWQIGQRKYGRINIEALANYDSPALVFEEGLVIDEEESFDLWGYVDETGLGSQGNALYQRIVPLGFAAYRVIDKVLGTCGANIT